MTNVPFSEAAPIIAMAANFEDEISAQMGESTTHNTAVLATGATQRTGDRTHKSGGWQGWENR